MKAAARTLPLVHLQTRLRRLIPDRNWVSRSGVAQRTFLNAPMRGGGRGPTRCILGLGLVSSSLKIPRASKRASYYDARGLSTITSRN
jgi:hypothetical protein